jgi:hypothetical protein
MSDSAPPNQDRTKQYSLFSRRIGLSPDTASAVKKRTFIYSLWLGGIAGLTFSLALWGYECLLFIEAHIAYPWLPLLLGTVGCVIICGLAALLTWLVNRALLGVIFWILAARLISELAIYLPLKIVPALMILFEPGLRSRLPVYPITDTLQTWAGFGTVWLAIFLGILGLLQITLVESAVPATTAAGRLVAYFIFVPVMILASVMSSNMINEQLRAPLITTDDGIQFFIEHQNAQVDPLIARQMHMLTFSTISNVINRPRRLFLGKYDQYYGQVDILIDFQGEWVDCNSVSGQPVFCKTLANP